MRQLIIANTYYQLIFAMQLKNTLFANDDVVLILSDHSQNTEVICKRLKEFKVFSETYYIKSKEIIYNEKNDFLSRMHQTISISFNMKNEYSFYLDEINNLFFDEVIFYNFETDIYALYSMLYKYNEKIIFSFMEEGILSYDFKIKNLRKHKVINTIRNIFYKGNILSTIKKIYCFFPENYIGELNTVRIPLIDYNGLTSIQLAKVFGLDKEKNPYDRKYIFFTSVYDFEGDYIGEYDIVSKVCELVGKENVIIKIHPRDSRDIYDKNGFVVDKNSAIPWEVIQLTYDFSDKIYLTATSGSVLAGSILSNNKIKTYYLCNLCDISKNEAAKVTYKNIKRTLNNEKMRDIFSSVKMIDDIEEIL